MSTMGHQFQLDKALRAWAPVLGDHVVTSFSCTCGEYSNMVSEKTAEASQLRARRMHGNHKAIKDGQAAFAALTAI